MAIETLDKVRLYIHHTKSADVLSLLQKKGVMELTEIKLGESLIKRDQQSFQYNRESSRLEFVVSFLSKYSSKKSGIRSVIEGDVRLMKEESVHNLLDTFSYNEVIDRVQNLEKDLNTIAARQKDLHEKELQLIPWQRLSIPINGGMHTRETKTLLIKGKNCDEAIRRLIKDGIPYHNEVVSEVSQALIVLNDDVESVNEVFAAKHIDVVTLPSFFGTASEAVLSMRSEILKYDKRKASTEGELVSIANSYLQKLKVLSDVMLWNKEKHEYVETAHSTGETVAFEGWIPRKLKDSTERDIAKITTLFAIEDAVISENEEPPVLLSNKGLIKPFETITKLYGVPGYKELDPTPFLAPFFFIFFGLCLTDVGYGITLAAVTGLILFMFRVEAGLKQMLQLLLLGGVGSATVGLFFAGYLGIDPSFLPEWLFALQYFDPIATPIPVLFLALGLGVTQIMVGIILKIFREAKNGALVSGLLDQVPWLLFFTSIILIGLHAFGIVPGTDQWFTYFLYFSIASLVLTQGRKEKSIGMKAFKGVASLYDSVGYFSDILSYSRLLALGLATTALAFSINLIAILLGEMIPVVGGVVTVVILVVGHIFNLGVNVLGAFIHSARLQFVEFFGKFVMSTGKDFRAFKRTERYVTTR
ncbi:hypothetical protein COB55_02080 [Candidatus Wolfebacteria bacterium]|nr:MAG: hypothetical protein COB55_02080 [Candidatus Wolfebacteria bacterium]